MSRILYIQADFDENELKTKIFESSSELIKYLIGEKMSFCQLEELVEGAEEFDDLDYEYRYLWELFTDTEVVGEWTTEKIYYIGQS